LFVKHPYDVGDRVDITGPEKEQLIVERISLLYTVFTRIDKMQVVQIPNIVLNTLWIENVSRSKAMKEGIDINVSYDTSFEEIELLRLEMENFVRAPENSRDFQQDIAIGVGGVGDLDKLQLKIAIKHKSNWHNDAVRATRRSKFICALTQALKKVPIYAPGGGGEALGGPTNPTYSVSVSDAEAATARDKAAQEKDAARLVPKNASTLSDVDPAAQGFNSINPLSAAEAGGSYNRDDDTMADTGRLSIDRVRSSGASSKSLRKTESQRSGFRRAGESVPAEAHRDRAPSFQVTQHLGAFDAEAQIGVSNPYAAPSQGSQSNNPPYPAMLSSIASRPLAPAASGSSRPAPPPGTHQQNPASQR